MTVSFNSLWFFASVPKLWAVINLARTFPSPKDSDDCHVSLFGKCFVSGYTDDFALYFPGLFKISEPDRKLATF